MGFCFVGFMYAKTSCLFCFMFLLVVLFYVQNLGLQWYHMDRSVAKEADELPPPMPYQKTMCKHIGMA